MRAQQIPPKQTIMMLYWEQLIHHAVDVALACNEDVRTALACVSFPELGSTRMRPWPGQNKTC
eukprot:4399058-Lingulodinium_polyedra.AAC.1